MSDSGLAARAVACKHWRRVAGMVSVDGWRIYSADRSFVDIVHVHTGDLLLAGDEWLPDLDDPATIGCLLALVREAHGNRTLTTNLAHFGWWVTGLASGGRTEIEALVAALEAAP